MGPIEFFRYTASSSPLIWVALIWAAADCTLLHFDDCRFAFHSMQICRISRNEQPAAVQPFQCDAKFSLAAHFCVFVCFVSSISVFIVINSQKTHHMTKRLAIHPYKLFLRRRKWRKEWGYKYWISETTWIDNLEIVGQLKLQKMVKLSGNWYLVKTRFICRGAVGDASPSLPLMTLMRRKKLAFKEIICSFFYSNQGHQMRGKGKHTSKKRKSGIILIFRS